MNRKTSNLVRRYLNPLPSLSALSDYKKSIYTPKAFLH